MKKLTQKFIGDDGITTYEIVHLYSETGYLKEKGDRKKKNQGWHIQLGTGANPDDYTEVKGDKTHEIPEALEDVEFHVMTEEEIAEIQKQLNDEVNKEIN